MTPYPTRAHRIARRDSIPRIPRHVSIPPRVQKRVARARASRSPIARPIPRSSRLDRAPCVPRSSRAPRSTPRARISAERRATSPRVTFRTRRRLERRARACAGANPRAGGEPSARDIATRDPRGNQNAERERDARDPRADARTRALERTYFPSRDSSSGRSRRAWGGRETTRDARATVFAREKRYINSAERRAWRRRRGTGGKKERLSSGNAVPNARASTSFARERRRAREDGRIPNGRL